MSSLTKRNNTFFTEVSIQGPLDFYRDPAPPPRTPFGKYVNQVRSSGTPEYYSSNVTESTKMKAKHVVQENSKKRLPRQPVAPGMPLEDLRKVLINEKREKDKLSRENVLIHDEVSRRFNNYVNGIAPSNKSVDSCGTKQSKHRSIRSSATPSVVISRPGRLDPVSTSPPSTEVPPEVLAMRTPFRPVSITSSVKLKPFDSSLQIKRPKTGSQGKGSLLPIPPADAFKVKKPGSADSNAKPFSIGRAVKTPQGVTSRVVKSADTELLSLEHDDPDDAMISPRERWSQIKPEMAWEPLKDKHTAWLDKMRSCMAGAQDVIEKGQEEKGGPTRSEVHRRCKNIWSGIDKAKPALPMVPEDALAEQYNHLVLALKDKVYQKGQQKVASMLEAKDMYRTGVIHVLDFKKAMEEELNLDLTDEVMEKLLEMSGAPSKTIINVQAFMDSIRLDTIPYMARPGSRYRRQDV